MNDEQVMHAMSIDDMYRVEHVLARGAGGVTELVTIDGAGPFVRKKIPNRLANQGVWSLIESCGCARLPKVEATYSLPDQFVVVYDFVPGQTLEELVVAKKRLVPEEAASLAADICEAAAALHSRGVVHRDLSPRNVIVAADGAHLIDLGIARMRVEGASRDTTPLGTRGFASPEQYGFAQTDARSDVYAIGKLLGYMLTGLQPDGDEYERALGMPMQPIRVLRKLLPARARSSRAPGTRARPRWRGPSEGPSARRSARLWAAVPRPARVRRPLGLGRGCPRRRSS